MSRLAEVVIDITGYDFVRVGRIKDAVHSEWECDQEDESSLPGDVTNLYMKGEGNIAAGETNAELTERISKAVWFANGRYCKVEVSITEPATPDVHCLEVAEHDRLMKDKEDYTG